MLRNVIKQLFYKINPNEIYEVGKVKPFSIEGLRGFLKKAYFWSNREAAMRYIPVVREINSHKKEYANILEVGSGTMGLSRFIKQNMIGVDIDPMGPIQKNMSLLIADAQQLPFNNNIFDLSLSIDMFEHVPPEKRKKILLELIRVTKKKIILGFPSGKEAKIWEDKAREVFKQKLAAFKEENADKQNFAIRNSFILEHLDCGLPEPEEIEGYIKEYMRVSGNKMQYKIIDNESLLVWYFGVLAFMKYSYLRWMITTLVFIVFFPVLNHLKLKGSYRKIFIMEKVLP